MLKEFRTCFQAMGTQVSILALGSSESRAIPALMGQVTRLFQQEEARFSRFCPDSELSRLNRDGHVVDPSPQLWDVLRRCHNWWQQTLGDFDPTTLSALEAAGYDRDFRVLKGNLARVRHAESSCALPPDFRHVTLAERWGHRCVCLETGVRVDLGGIGKGWAVDSAAEVLAPVENYLIDAGGEVLVRGDSLEPPGWCVAIEDPFHPGQDRGYLVRRNAAVATSGSYRRQWQTTDGEAAHHLIDPITQKPSLSTPGYF